MSDSSEKSQADIDAEAYFAKSGQDPSSNVYQGFVTPEKKGEAAAPPSPPAAGTTAANQQAARKVYQDVASRISSGDIGNVEPRHIAAVPGALLGASAIGRRVGEMFDPLFAKARVAQRLEMEKRIADVEAEAKAAAEAKATGQTQKTILERTKTPGGGMAGNYLATLGASTGEQTPEAVMAKAEDMTKGKHPLGLGAHDIAAADAENVRKIENLVGGGWQLRGENVSPKASPSFQLMLSPKTQAELDAAKAVQATAQAAAAQSPLGSFANTASTVGQKVGSALAPLGAFLSSPAIQRGMTGANYFGAGMQGLLDYQNRDPVGGAITAAQLAASSRYPWASFLTAESARYLREHPELSQAVMERMMKTPITTNPELVTGVTP